MSLRASFLDRALSVTNTLLVAPFAFATVTAEFLPLLAAVTAEVLIEAMASPPPKRMRRATTHPGYAGAQPGHTTSWPGYGPGGQMQHAGYLSPAALDMVERFLLPAPHHLWLYMENQEVKCMASSYERKEISATWANLNISRILWNAQHTRATCAAERKSERDALDDLTRALDRLDRPPRPPRPDPPVLQSSPRPVRRYPTPGAMRNIRGRRV